VLPWQDSPVGGERDGDHGCSSSPTLLDDVTPRGLAASVGC
jgi:hypothetical protein